MTRTYFALLLLTALSAYSCKKKSKEVGLKIWTTETLSIVRKPNDKIRLSDDYIRLLLAVPLKDTICVFNATITNINNNSEETVDCNIKSSWVDMSNLTKLDSGIAKAIKNQDVPTSLYSKNKISRETILKNLKAILWTEKYFENYIFYFPNQSDEVNLDSSFLKFKNDPDKYTYKSCKNMAEIRDEVTRILTYKTDTSSILIVTMPTNLTPAEFRCIFDPSIDCLCEGCDSGQLIFKEMPHVEYNDAYYDVFKVKINNALVNSFNIRTNQGGLSEENYFNLLSNSLNSRFFAITSSIVDKSCNPIGLCISGGRTENNINLNHGAGNKGNFYLENNGIFSIGADGNVSIRNSSTFNSSIHYNYAIQSGPMLIDNGAINSNFGEYSQSTYVRCGVGISNENDGVWLVFIKSEEPLNFFHFAKVFKDAYHCSNALNLEGGDFCSMHLPSVSYAYRQNLSVCRYLVINVP